MNLSGLLMAGGIIKTRL